MNNHAQQEMVLFLFVVIDNNAHFLFWYIYMNGSNDSITRDFVASLCFLLVDCLSLSFFYLLFNYLIIYDILFN